MTESGDKYILSDWYVTDFSNGYHHIVVKDRSSGIISIKVETTYYRTKLMDSVTSHSFFIDRRTLNSIFINYYLSRLIWNLGICKDWFMKPIKPMVGMITKLRKRIASIFSTSTVK